MNNSTQKFAGIFRRSMLVAVFGVGASVTYGQTFAYEGLIYKADAKQKTELTIQKPGTKVTVGDAGPTSYEGEIRVPAKFTYNGTEYHVNTFTAATFKSQKVTSVIFEDGSITVFPKGGLMNHPELTSVKLPEGLVTMNAQALYNCPALTEIEIPGTVETLDNNQFSLCTGLKKVVIKEGEKPLVLTSLAFKELKDAKESSIDGVTEVVLMRQVNTEAKNQEMLLKPFRGAKSLENVTIGGSFVTYPASYFENATLLSNVTITNEPKEFNTNLFANTGIVEFTYPASLTDVPASIFQNAKKLKKVVLPEGVSTISTMAFLNSTLAEINYPSTLTSIGSMTFSGTALSGKLELNEGLKTIGQQAYANNAALTAVAIPSTVKSLGEGAFMGCTSIAAYTVAEGNESYKSDATSSYIYTADGSSLFAFAPASALKELKGDFKTVVAYACYKAAGLTVVELPACVNWGDYSFSETSVESLSLQGTIGRYVAKSTPLVSITLDNMTEVPFGVVMDCAKLTDVNIKCPITIVKQDAFRNCTSLEKLNLGNILAILEADCFTGSGLKNITVAAANPAGMAEGVFTEQSGYTVNVPVDFVETYKTAAGWSLLNIVGDANIAAGPSDMGMPNGLYYAGEDGNLHAVYADGQSDSYDVGGAYHTFQLSQFQNRIYGASAGKKFVYSAASATEGDGKLFYISQVGGNIFQAVVLDNYGLNAYKDPFGLYIFGDELFVSDRNVAIRKVKADAIALNSATYPSWIENNWMGFYNQEWSYGNIKCGWAITSSADNKPIYWLGIKYNGNGIYRFTDENVGTAEKIGTRPEKGVFLNACNMIITTFYIDEANKHMYVYLETDGGDEATMARGGVYRIDMDVLEANPDPKRFLDLNPVLVDGAPVKYEGSGTNEHVGISQFSADEKGEYLYWCYRAPSAEEAAANEAQDLATAQKGRYWWAEKYDEANPMHHSGIKRIKLGEAQPKVEMVAEGVNGYGIVPVNYEGSEKPNGVQSVIVDNANSAITVDGDIITVSQDAIVTVYNLNGVMVDYAVVAAGESVSVSHLPAGAYVVSAALENGKTAIAKFVK